jgi:uncharacterized protein YkwD
MGGLGKKKEMRHVILIALLLAAMLLLVGALPSHALEQTLLSIITPSATTGPCPDLAPSPNYYTNGSEQTAIEAINHARAAEGLPPLNLPGNYWQLSPSQQQFTLVNLERASRGLHALHWDANLAEIATNYSQQMAQLHFFSHTSPISGDFQTRLNNNPAVSGHYTSIAENIAGNWAPAAGAVYEYLYHDAAEQCAHRQNILNPAFTLIGIGVVSGGPWGALSAEELLAPTPDNPYAGAAPDTTPPTINISSTLNQAQTTLHLAAHASDNQGIADIIWYLDGIGHQSHQGAEWTITAATLSPGQHTLTAYAVDDSQGYAAATLALTVNGQGIAVGK